MKALRFKLYLYRNRVAPMFVLIMVPWLAVAAWAPWWVLGFSIPLLFVSALLLVVRLTRAVEVPGYTATMLAVLFSFSTLVLGLGIIGGYVWRISENTKGRPSYLVSSVERIAPRVGAPVAEEHV